MSSSFKEVIARVKGALAIKSDAALARALGLETTTFYERKKRGSLPFEALCGLAQARGLDLNYLLLGRPSAPAIPSTDEDLATIRRYCEMVAFAISRLEAQRRDAQHPDPFQAMQHLHVARPFGALDGIPDMGGHGV